MNPRRVTAFGNYYLMTNPSGHAGRRCEASVAPCRPPTDVKVCSGRCGNSRSLRQSAALILRCTEPSVSDRPNARNFPVIWM
jgi:hypothetical protein